MLTFTWYTLGFLMLTLVLVTIGWQLTSDEGKESVEGTNGEKIGAKEVIEGTLWESTKYSKGEEGETIGVTRGIVEGIIKVEIEDEEDGVEEDDNWEKRKMDSLN